MPEIEDVTDEVAEEGNCPVCQQWIRVGEKQCGNCGIRFFKNERQEIELLRHIASNVHRIRKHVVFWSIFSAVMMVLGLALGFFFVMLSAH